MNVHLYVLFQKLTVKIKKMSCEFDFAPQQIDQRIMVLPIPHGRNQSLSMSRFKDDNMNSHRKILHDLEQYIQDSKNKQNERIRLLKQKQKKIGEQMGKQMAYKEMRRRELENQQKEKLFSQCTFKPKTNYEKAPKRNFNQFLENQYAHTQKVKDKCEILKKNIEQKKEKGTYKPKINNNSTAKRKESNQSTTVFQRLYALSQKQKQAQPEVNNFHPTINVKSKNLIREGPVQEILYEDAMRRQQKGKQIIHTNTSISQKTQKPINYNNQKYAAQKFIKQYFFTLQDLQIDTSFQANIQYVVFNELLKKLGFVANQQEQQTKSSSIQRTLVHDAFQILQKYKVNARNVCVFLLGIIGIYHINPVNFQEGEEPEPEKQFNLDDNQGRKLQRQFNLFYRNRLCSDSNRKTQQKNESFSFQPNINKQSVQMAQKHRNVMLQQANKLLQQCPQLQFKIPEDGVISHTELLVLNKIAKDLKKQRQKEERVDEQLKQCTFKPNTMISSLGCSKASQSANVNAGSKKSSELYEYHKEVKIKKESLQASRHQQADPQCTFKPQINRNKPPKKPLVPPSKQTQQTLYRLHKGRQQHEQKKKFFERGEKIKQVKQPVKQINQIPTLILDVNLGQKVDRIILYRGDENRLSQVTQQFGQKHNLDQESQRKLLQMLKTELQNVLSKIDEDQESQEYQN